MAITLDELIESLVRARDAVNGVDGNSTVEVWLDENAQDTTLVRDVISDQNGVSILLELD